MSYICLLAPAKHRLLPTKMVFTSSDVFLQTLEVIGITTVFVNLGSDHPALLEALAERQKTGNNAIQFITCPNEMQALSSAQGYAQVTGWPAAVIVHVDCGTQALAGAVHNVARCRVPVLIHAGAAPYTLHGELPGSRNEFMFTLQDVPDQPAIVRQYMKHTALIRTGKNIAQVLIRAVMFAVSEPRGPVYCWAGREAMEESLDKNLHLESLGALTPLEPAALNPEVVSRIVYTLSSALHPVVVTSYLGRNPKAVVQLVELSELLGLPVLCSCPTVVNFPANHPHFVDVDYGGKSALVEQADVIIVIDSDIPWIPLHLNPDAAIIHIDVDPLKEDIALVNIRATVRAKADAELALTQIISAVPATLENKIRSLIQSRSQSLQQTHTVRTQALADSELLRSPSGQITVPNVLGTIRRLVPENTVYFNEGISNYPLVWNHLAPSRPGQMFTSGGSSLGWGLGATIGAILGERAVGNTSDLHVLLTGDGSYLFGVPSSSFWVARRYKTPFLTIVFNNGGWKSPRLSLLAVHPQGVASTLPASDLPVTFGDESEMPDYGGIAAAAGGAWAGRLKDFENAENVLKEAIRVVREEKRCAVLDVWLERF